MELHIPGIIRKNASDFSMELRDISTSGLSCYTNQTVYEGTRFEILLADQRYEAEVIRQFPAENYDSKKIGLGLRFCSDNTEDNTLKELIESLPLSPDSNLWPQPHEQRRHPRKSIDGEVKVREVCPKLLNNDFSLFHHGLTCHVDQYVPLFREIEITIECSATENEYQFSGIVVECKKMNDGDYCLEIFCPTCERDNYKNLISAN